MKKIYERYCSLHPNSKVLILAVFAFTVIFAVKIASDFYDDFRRFQERRAAIRSKLDKLKEQTDSTILTIESALDSLKKAKRPKDWIGKYKDAWGNDLKLMKLNGTHQGWAVVSAGPDKFFGNADDIRREDAKFSFTGAAGSLIFDNEDEVIEEEKPKPNEGVRKWWSF